MKPAERTWQTANNTYAFARGLGTVELAIGLLTLAGVASRRLGFVGATLAFLTPFVTLSFLITTPEAWVPALGDAQHGFPYLSGPGRLVLKDVALLAGGLLVMADSARALLKDRLVRRGTATLVAGSCGNAAAPRIRDGRITGRRGRASPPDDRDGRPDCPIVDDLSAKAGQPHAPVRRRGEMTKRA